MDKQGRWHRAIAADRCARTPQETVADELEEGYRREIWNPAKGHVKEQKQGVAAAHVDLRTLVNEAKVGARV